MANEADPLMFEMKEKDEEVIQAEVAPVSLDMPLLEDAALCQASCLADPQVRKMCLRARLHMTKNLPTTFRRQRIYNFIFNFFLRNSIF